MWFILVDKVKWQKSTFMTGIILRPPTLVTSHWKCSRQQKTVSSLQPCHPNYNSRPWLHHICKVSRVLVELPRSVVSAFRGAFEPARNHCRGFHVSFGGRGSRSAVHMPYQTAAIVLAFRRASFLQLTWTCHPVGSGPQLSTGIWYHICDCLFQ